ncbi:ricin-type beta-trefoil lectin domain protein [Kitasatospora sp. NPDC097691]|uniref:RICIN domain-containing protein n=1 Tax=Kitasatospora sp. NPDC097691 TaxID=3157231 RepID=UPI0033174AC4
MNLRKATAACVLASALGLTLGTAPTASASSAETLVVSSVPSFAEGADSIAKPPAALLADSAAGHRLRNRNSNKCLVVQGNADRAIPFQYQCLDFYDQAWGYISIAPGFNLIKNLNSNKCIAAQGNSDGTQAIQVDCNGNFSDQVWYTQLVWYNGEQLVQFTKSGTNLSLAVQGYEDNKQLIQVTNGAFADQYWRVAW